MTQPPAGRCSKTCLRKLRRIEAEYSPYIEASELSRLNREAGGGWVETTPEMIDLLAKSARVSEMTGGAFDITYASVGRYYDYRAGERPDDEALRAGLEAINYEYVEIEPESNRVRFAHPLVYVDLGGIAKGVRGGSLHIAARGRGHHSGFGGRGG